MKLAVRKGDEGTRQFIPGMILSIVPTLLSMFVVFALIKRLSLVRILKGTFSNLDTNRGCPSNSVPHNS